MRKEQIAIIALAVWLTLIAVLHGPCSEGQPRDILCPLLHWFPYHH